MVPGLLALERDAIFTAPDVKSAISNMIFLESDIFFENNSRINLGGFLDCLTRNHLTVIVRN